MIGPFSFWLQLYLNYTIAYCARDNWHHGCCVPTTRLLYISQKVTPMWRHVHGCAVSRVSIRCLLASLHAPRLTEARSVI